MDPLGLATVAVTGFTASSEFGSWAFVHPVVRQLPAEQHIIVEQGLLGTFGRVMPVLMPLTGVLTVVDALRRRGRRRRVALAAATSALGAVAVTLAGNVPINTATASWDPVSPPPDWKAQRDRWERLQGIRSSLLLGSFGLVALGASMEG